MKRPLVGIAVVFGCGIALGDGARWPAAWLGVAFAVAVAAAATLRRHRAAGGILFASIFCGGLLAHAMATRHPQPNHLLRLIGHTPQNAAVRVVITDEPVRRVFRAARSEKERDHFMARVEAANAGGGWRAATGNLVVWLDTPGDLQLRYGDRIEFSALLRHPQPPANPGLFDYPAYLARRGVFYEARIHSADAVTLLAHHSSAWMDAGMWLQRRFLASTARGLETAHAGDEETIVGLLRAMLVGFRPGLTHELAEPFMQTGTLHVFAVSGLHVAVIAGILVGLLRFCRVPRPATAAIALPLLLVYTIATGAPASAMRSFLMAAIVIIGWSLSRPTDMLNNIAAAALAVLLLDPLQLFDVGFQLSFAVVIAIALLVPGTGFLGRALYHQPQPDAAVSRLPSWCPHLLADALTRDPYLPAGLLPRWRRWLHNIVAAVAASFSVSVAACLGSIPLIAHYFHLFTTVNFLSNLVIVPLSSLAITVGLASFLADLIWPPLAAILNNANYLFMELMVAASHGFAAVPGAFIYIKSPPLWLTIGFYLVGALFLCKSLWQHARRLRWSAVIAVSALAVGLAARNSDQTVTVTALNVGNGSAIFLDLPGETHDTLVDCGSARMAEVITKPFLRAQGADRIETLVLTHADAGHVAGVGVVLDAFKPRRIYDNGNTRWTRTAGGDVRPYQALRLVAGASVPLAEGVELRVLHPPTGRLPARGDDAALVLQLRAGIHRILLMSDATAEVERRLVAERTDVRSDVLVRGMPSRGNCCTEEFLDAVAAETVVIQCGEYPPSEQPAAAALDRIHRHGARLLRTDADGAVTMRLAPDHMTIKSFSSPAPSVVGSARREQIEPAIF